MTPPTKADDAVCEVRSAAAPVDLDHVRRFFKEYLSSLGSSVSMKALTEELADLPGEYGPPTGALLIAYLNGRPAGCVALRPLTGRSCEMRRLYVSHTARGKGVGRRLATAAIDHARLVGFGQIRLHTAPWMKEAIELYTSLGFAQIDAYRDTTLAGAVFFEMDLATR